MAFGESAATTASPSQTAADCNCLKFELPRFKCKMSEDLLLYKGVLMCYFMLYQRYKTLQKCVYHVISCCIMYILNFGSNPF